VTSLPTKYSDSETTHTVYSYVTSENETTDFVLHNGVEILAKKKKHVSRSDPGCLFTEARFQMSYYDRVKDSFHYHLGDDQEANEEHSSAQDGSFSWGQSIARLVRLEAKH
jgi:hypothetical protein